MTRRSAQVASAERTVRSVKAALQSGRMTRAMGLAMLADRRAKWERICRLPTVTGEDWVLADRIARMYGDLLATIDDYVVTKSVTDQSQREEGTT